MALFFLALLTPAGAIGQQVLRAQRPAVVQRLKPIGSVAQDAQLDLAIELPLRNREELERLMREIYSPGSACYRHYLTPAAFAEMFGPTQSDYSETIAFATSHRLRVTGTTAGRDLLNVRGAARDIEAAFHLKLRFYKHPSEDRTFFAPENEPSVDLGVRLLGVSGLNNYALPRAFGHPMSGADKPRHSSPNGGSGNGGAYIGSDFRNAYAPGIPLTGTGQVIGLVEMDGYYSNDIASYETAAGLPSVPLENVLLDGVSGIPSSNSLNVGEVSLDIEMAIAMAPGVSNIICYEGAVPVDIINRMATDNLARQLSSSWDVNTEGDADYMGQKAAQFALQGQTFFQSSGDDGAYVQGIGNWSSNPNATIVGGTVLTTGSGASWQAESVWSGSGGGPSLTESYVIPSWQMGIPNSANQASTTLRNSPDVAAVGAGAWVIYDNGNGAPFQGTSIAAPLWAGLTALINQQVASNGGGSVGFLNPALYAIGTGPNYNACFHDVTNGNNGYNAVAGYDLCTGWGTPTANLFRSLAGLAPTLTITSPLNADVFAAPATVTFSASVSDSSRQVTNVQFLLNGNVVSNLAAAPYSLSASNLAAGSYTLSAIAADTNGLVANGSLQFVVSSGLIVAITNPIAGSAVGTSEAISIDAVAADPSGTITNVQFLLDGNVVGSSIAPPYTVSAGNLAAGSYTLTAIASDTEGFKATNAEQITVVGPPSVAITNPFPGEVFASQQTVTIFATASSPGGTVTNVQFLVNGGVLGNSPAPPYAATTTGLAVGTYALSAIASDNYGSKATNSVQITVLPPPAVTITAPSGGALFAAPANVTVTASASSSSAAITNVQFILSIGTVGSVASIFGNCTIPPYSAIASNLDLGSYTISVVAKDTDGLSATNSIRITVVSSPSLAITNSAGGQLGLIVSGLTIGTTSYLQSTSNLSPSIWITVATNISISTNAIIEGIGTMNPAFQFFRVVEIP